MMKLKLISMLLCMALLLTACGSQAASAEASASAAGSASTASAASAAESTTAAEAQTADNTAAQSAAETAEAAQTDTGAAAAAQTEEAVAATPTPTMAPGIEFPVELDEGRLTATSVFQSSVPNPDCDGADGEDIATIEIVNQSGMYLDSAAYTVTLTDGEVFSFETDGIPDGATVWAFDLSNQTCEQQPQVADITCTAYYQDASPMMSDAVSVEMADITANVTNVSGGDLSGLRIGYHSLLDGVYFGGKASVCELDSLPAGSTASVELTDCWLGTAECVYVVQSEETADAE